MVQEGNGAGGGAPDQSAHENGDTWAVHYREGRSVVLLNGHPLRNVNSVSLEVGAENLVRMTIDLIPDVLDIEMGDLLLYSAEEAHEPDGYFPRHVYRVGSRRPVGQSNGFDNLLHGRFGSPVQVGRPPTDEERGF